MNTDIIDNLFQLDKEINKSEHDQVIELMKFARKNYFDKKISVYIDLIDDMADPLNYYDIKFSNVGHVIVQVSGVMQCQFDDIDKFINAMSDAKEHAYIVLDKITNELGLEKHKVILKFK